jgi:hypothetical protein
VSPIHTCLFIGMFMPAMRAIYLYRPPMSRKKRGIVPEMIAKLPLTLLVPRIRRADHVDDATAAHDLAVLADLLDRRTYFHNYPPDPERP